MKAMKRTWDIGTKTYDCDMYMSYLVESPLKRVLQRMIRRFDTIPVSLETILIRISGCGGGRYIKKLKGIVENENASVEAKAASDEKSNVHGDGTHVLGQVRASEEASH